MSPISRGFRGRSRGDAPRDRVPPGQYVTDDFPGALRRADAAHAARRVDVHDRRRDRRAAPLDVGRVPRAAERARSRRDIHCVTKWSKLDTEWEGVSVDTLLDGVDTEAEYVVAFCDGGYTTNLPLEDVTGGKAWVAFGYGGEPLDPEHGGPARLLVPHLYFWKSAKWVRGLTLRATTSRASGSATATTTTAIRGGSSGTGATDVAPRRGRRRRRTETPAHAHARPRRRRLERPPRRAARRRPADGGGRLPGGALVLDRVGARGRRASS